MYDSSFRYMVWVLHKVIWFTLSESLPCLSEVIGNFTNTMLPWAIMNVGILAFLNVQFNKHSNHN